MRVFRLFCFSDGNSMIITRGLTQEQALSYCAKSPLFRRGSTIFPINYCPINAFELYSQNHSDGWMYRAPVWLRKLEHKRAAKLGVKGVIEEITSKLNSKSFQEPVLMFNESRSMFS